MICPVCKTNNTKDQEDEGCVQCGSDLKVHRLLLAVREEIQMNNEEPSLEQAAPKKLSSILIIVQIIPSILFLICTVFGIFVGMQFLTFLKHAEFRDISRSAKSEIGIEQLQQMSSIIKQELNLIIDQRQENQVLQAKVQELANINAMLTHKMEPTRSPPVLEEMQ